MVKILETTLRDGSYVVDFQFTSHDTEQMCHGLDYFKFDYIEVGHGLGLGASGVGKHSAFCSDQEYITAARKSIKHAKLGVFFIPGIGHYNHIDAAVANGIDFLRIGININEIETSLPYIEYAKKNSLEVCANFMKSYAVSAIKFAKFSHQAKNAGADIVYIVDSAGGMMPTDVEKYFTAAHQLGDINLGFHGHDNLRLAVANTYKAIECGAYVVDVTLQGLGRGGGNAATEALIAILKNQGKLPHFDLYGLLDFSELHIKPLLREKGINDISLISGQGLFHSSFLPRVEYFSDKYKVDPRRIIIKLKNIDVIEPTNEMIEKIAKELAADTNISPILFKSGKEYELNREVYATRENFMVIINEVQMLAKKFNKLSVCNIVQPLFENRETCISSNIQINQFIVASIEVQNLFDLQKFFPMIDQCFDVVLFDGEVKVKDGNAMWDYVRTNNSSAKLLRYRDSEVWAKAIENIVISKKPHLTSVFITGYALIEAKLKDAFASQGVRVFTKEDIPTNLEFDVIIGVSEDMPVLFFSQLSKSINKHTLVVDGGFGSIDSDLLSYATLNDIEIIRTDMRYAIEAEIKNKLASLKLVEEIQGKREIAGISCVAGGTYGAKGSIVLDHITKPKKILGIADGRGKVNYKIDKEYQEQVDKIEAVLFAETI